MTSLCPLSIEKLASSGISGAVAKRCGIYSVENAALAVSAEYEPRPALVFPYYDQNGEPIYFERDDGFHPFQRLRYLGARPASFAPRGPMRYQQQKASGTFAYFPPLFDWAAIFEDPSFAVAITEGELKAIAACSQGLPTIGLAGVDCFRRRVES